MAGLQLAEEVPRDGGASNGEERLRTVGLFLSRWPLPTTVIGVHSTPATLVSPLALANLHLRDLALTT